MLVACDVYRPAAIKQLQVLASQVGVSAFTIEGSKEPVAIAKEAVEYAKKHNNDVILIDTAGRLTIDTVLMEELKNIKAAVMPHEILLVLDSMTGQDAVTTAKAFDESLGIDGTVLTKMDGDARGGAALSIKAVTGKPIKLIGVSEKLDGGLEDFYPDRMAGRILDLGDLASLFEQAQRNLDQDTMKEAATRLRKGQFTLDDFLKQLHQIKKMGSLQSIIGMLPGMGKFKDQLKNLDLDSKEMKHLEAIILSMTNEERNEVDILNGSRRKRIAQGAGVQIQDVNRLVKQFKEMRKQMKRMKNKKINPSLLKNFGNFTGMFR